MLEIFILSTILGFLFLLYIRRYDIWEPEPLHQLLLVGFLGGLISVLTTTILYWLTERYFGSIQHSAFHSYLFIGPIEEGSKLLAYIILFHSVFRRQVDEPVDSIIYMSSVALGFSFFENIMYASKGGTGVLFLRYLFASPAHILFALPMAMPLYAVLNNTGKKSRLLKFWLFSAFLHGTWDAFAFSGAYTIVFLGLLMLMFGYANSRISTGLLASQFYPDIKRFFEKGRPRKSAKVYCVHCKAYKPLTKMVNDKVAYYRCDECDHVIVDRDNAFRIIHRFFATFANLSKEYLPSSKDPKLHTLRDCVFIDDSKKYGVMDIDELVSRTNSMRMDARYGPGR